MKKGRPVKTPGNDNIFAEIRRKTGWSQAVLAEKIGVERQTIARYERGERKISGPAQLLAEQILKGVIEKENTANPATKEIC